jgi:hypothetical protein
MRSPRGLDLPALVVVTIILLTCSQTADAVPMTTGATETIGNVLPDKGTTSYVIYYSYPSVAYVGGDLTISLTLHVNQFTGLVEYIVSYTLRLQLFVGASSLQKTLIGPQGLNDTLYPGATWGPKNFTFPLNESDTRVSPGTSENATLEVTLSDSVFYGEPYLIYESEPPMEAQAGSLIIESQPTSSTTTASTATRSGGSQSLLLYALLASGVVLIVAAALILRRPRPPATNVSAKQQTGPIGQIGMDTKFPGR